MYNMYSVLAKVYMCSVSSALKGQTLQNLMCSKYIYRSKWVNRFWLVKALSCIVEGGHNDSKNQSQMPLCARLSQHSKQELIQY